MTLVFVLYITLRIANVNAVTVDEREFWVHVLTVSWPRQAERAHGTATFQLDIQVT